MQSSGTYTFAAQTDTSVTQALVVAVENDGIEAVECFEVQIDAISPTGTTAADELGDISTAEICVLDTDNQGEYQSDTICNFSSVLITN